MVCISFYAKMELFSQGLTHTGRLDGSNSSTGGLLQEAAYIQDRLTGSGVSQEHLKCQFRMTFNSPV